MILMIDNYDSFVYNLVRYVKELGEEVEVCKNDKLDLKNINLSKYKGIIISPGPKSPDDAGICLDVIDNFKEKIPILGICLGHQCIGSYFGAKIIKGESPVHGKLSLVKHNSKDLFYKIKNPITVTRYHSLIIDSKTLPSDLEVTAVTEDGVIMGIKHKKYDAFGVQFHPEAELTEQGHMLLNNFLRICNRRNINED